MNRPSKRVIDRTLRWSPAQQVFKWRASWQLTVLAYHAIEDPILFGRHLDYVCHSMNAVSLDEVIEATKGRDLPRHAVLISFDDNSRSIVDVAMPMLFKRGLPAVAFVVAGLLDTDRPLWVTEVEELVRLGGTATGFSALSPEALKQRLKSVPDQRRTAAIAELRQTSGANLISSGQLGRGDLSILESAGIAVGNHSLTHPCLPRCSEDKIEEEVSQAHEIIEAAIGHPPKAFAYPNGDFDDGVVQAVRATGYDVAFLFDHQGNALPFRHSLQLSRVRVDSTTSLDRFRIIVSGFHPALHQVRMKRREHSTPE
jgi:peptidoglycan/xylan/chitin deacetylase (PgdA/CDA1 family)